MYNVLQSSLYRARFSLVMFASRGVGNTIKDRDE
jgi:hypothetical protein